MKEHLRVLLIEDVEDDALLIVDSLRRADYEISFTRVETEKSFLHELHNEYWDLILCDYNLPGYSAIEALQAMKESGLDLPFLVVSGTIGEEKAVELLRAGAHDYVIKDHLFRLAPAVKRELRDADIRKQNRISQAAIQESEERFRSMSENSPDAIIIINAYGVIEYWNPKAGEIFGYTDDEAVGEKVEIILPENFIEKHRKGIEPVITTGATKIVGRTIRVEGQRKDGTLIPLELSLAMWRQGDQPYFSAVLRDITERKQAEEKILRMLEQQTAINELAIELGVTSDLNQIYDNIYRHINNLTDAWGFAVSSFNHKTQLIQAEYVLHDGVSLDVAGFPLIPLGEPGRGTQSRVIHTGEPFYSPDYKKTVKTSRKEYRVEKNGTLTEDPQPREDQEDTARSALFVPMKVAGETVGVMQLQSPRLDAYPPEDIILLTTLANVAAGTIHRVQAEGEIQQYIRRLDALHNIDQAIIGSLDLDITLNILLDNLLAQLEVDAAAVLSYQEDLQTLQFTHSRGFHTTALQYTDLRLGHGYAGEVGLQREHLFIPDLSKDEGKFQESTQFGEEGFAAYYGVPLIAKGKLVGVLEIFHRSPLEPDDEWVNYLQMMTGQAAIAIDNITLFNDLQRSNVDLTLAYDATIEGWAHALELKDMETEGHSRRVVEMTMDMANRMGISGEKLAHIRRGALLHDIGKMGVPDSILQKPGKLTDEEWQIMKQHPVYAYKWLFRIEYLRPALEIPYAHHEKWDGSGYPRGLEGEQIPLEARIFAIVDVWDALRSDRPYRKAWSKDKTLAHIQEQSGKHFDPRVVKEFLLMIDSA